MIQSASEKAKYLVSQSICGIARMQYDQSANVTVSATISATNKEFPLERHTGTIPSTICHIKRALPGHESLSIKKFPITGLLSQLLLRIDQKVAVQKNSPRAKRRKGLTCCNCDSIRNDKCCILLCYQCYVRIWNPNLLLYAKKIRIKA